MSTVIEHFLNGRKVKRNKFLKNYIGIEREKNKTEKQNFKANERIKTWCMSMWIVAAYD